MIIIIAPNNIVDRNINICILNLDIVSSSYANFT